MEAKRPPHNISWILCLVFIVVAVGISAAGNVYYTRQRDQIRSGKEDELEAIASLKVKEIVDWRSERVADARYLNKNRLFLEFVKRLLDHPADSKSQNLVMEWLLPMKENHDYRTILLLDREGRVRFEVGRGKVPLNDEAKEIAVKSLSNKEVIFADLEENEGGEGIHLDMFVPLLITQDRDTVPLGILFFRIDPSKDLYPLIQSWPTPSRTSETLLIRQEGNDVIYLNELRHRRNIPLRMRFPIGEQLLPAAMAARGVEGKVEGIDYRSQRVFAVIRRVPNTAWALVAKVDTEELFAPIRELAWHVTLVALALIVGAGLGVSGLWRYQQGEFHRRLYESSLERQALAKHFEYLTKYANDILLFVNSDGRIIECNDRAVAAYGYSRDELLQLEIGALLEPDKGTEIRTWMEELEQRDGMIYEAVQLRKSGSKFPVEVSARVVPVEGRKFYQYIIRDITERKNAEVKIQHLNRVYALLSQINQTIVRVRDRNTLIAEVCRVAIDYGGFRMAWIGFLDAKGHGIKPIASAGAEEGYLTGARISSDDTPGGRGPTGTAVREARAVICNDIETDPHMSPWRAEAAKRGYRSSIALPICLKDRVIAVYNLYASERDFFTPQEVKLLEEVTADLSFALESIEQEQQRRLAEEGLRASAERFRAVFQEAGISMTLVDATGRVVETNRAMQEVFGYNAEEFRLKNFGEIIHPADLPASLSLFQNLVSGEISRTPAVEKRYLRKNGQIIWGRHVASVVRDAQGRFQFAVGMVEDNTERKKIEEALRESEDRYRDLVENSQDLICTHDMEGRILSLNRGAAKLLGYISEALVGRSIRDILAPENRKGFTEYLEEIKRTGKSHGLMTVQTVTGQKRVWEYDNNVRTEGVSSPVVRGMAHDITERLLAEKALKESEASFRYLFASNPHPMWLYDLRTLEFLEVNETAIAKYGYSRDEFLHMRITDIRQPEDIPRLLENIKRDRPPLQFSGEWRHRLKGGRIIDVEITSHRLKFKERDTALVVAHDITERKQVEEELRKSEGRFRLVWENATDGMRLTDGQGTVLAVNEAFCRMVGKPRTEVEGYPMSAVYASADHDRILRKHIERFASREVPAYLERQMTLRNGRNIWLEVSNCFIETDPSRPLLLGVFRDVTDRKRAEEALRRSEQRLSLHVQQTPLGVIEWNLDFRVTAWNPAAEAIFGYTAAEAIGSHASFIVPESARGHVDAVWSTLLAQQGGQRSTNENVRKDGATIFCEWYNTPLINDEGSVVAVASLVEDVTEHKKLEEQFLQAQKMEAVGRLSGGIAHDFNNLLGVIIGFSDLLRERIQGDDVAHRHIDQIRKAGDSAARLTRQLLAFSRTQVLKPQVLDLNSVISDTGKMLPRLIGEDIKLITVGVPDLGRVKADPGQIEQVILNLVVNARDAMPKGGKLTIETANVVLDESYTRSHAAVVPGRYVMLTVSDTGVGMDADIQAHIFEPFFTTKEKGKGTGLGLATVYGIVKQSGGNIWVYSEPGKGTTFKIYLPRVDAKAETTGVQVMPEATEGGSETILLVEDAEALRALAREVLERAGYTVLDALDGSEGVRVAEQHKTPIHLLLTDVVMPGMSGRDVAEQVKRHHPETKVLFMSGYTDNSIVHHGILEEGVAFLSKPFASEVLVRKIRQVLDA